MQEACQPEPWAALARPAAYPGDRSAGAGVEWIQTHISHVYRTPERVYKFRKPVDLGFVRFASRAERDADCLREVALNRRLAPDVYLGVAALRGEPGALHLGPVAEELAGAAEHCVVMRRLPDGRDALSLLRAGRLSPSHLEALAGLVARFHAAHGLGVPAPFSRDEWLERCTRPAADNFESLGRTPGGRLDAALLERARSRSAALALARAERFERRRQAGRAVDGHGDLHLEHVWFEDEERPIAIDCIEFDERLRRIDAAAEVAFPAMDLVYRGRPELAEGFLAGYARESDDFDLYSVLDWFVAYRAGVRAKVAALAAADAEIAAEQRERAGESARRHLELATRALEERPAGPLVLVSGVVGAGKSSVARALADLVGGVVVSSDRVRKRLLGLPPTARARADWGGGAYAPAVSERTYAGLLERARPVLASGRPALCDATFSRRAWRRAAVDLAQQLGSRALLIEVSCDARVARERLARRAKAGGDPSDAGPEDLERSARDFEAAGEWPAERALIRTDRADWRECLEGIAGRIRERGR